MSETTDKLLTVREGRRHPDIFTAEEAADYLRVGSTETILWLERKHALASYTVGKLKLFDRADLDECWQKVTGRGIKPTPSQGMKLNLG